MRTIYIYLSVTGWIWFAIAGSYLFWKLRSKFNRDLQGAPAGKRGFEVISTEAKQPNEQ